MASILIKWTVPNFSIYSVYTVMCSRSSFWSRSQIQPWFRYFFQIFQILGKTLLLDVYPRCRGQGLSVVKRSPALLNGSVAIEIEATSLDWLQQLEVPSRWSVKGHTQIDLIPFLTRTWPSITVLVLCRLLKFAESSVHKSKNGKNESTSKTEQSVALLQRSPLLHRLGH